MEGIWSSGRYIFFGSIFIEDIEICVISSFFIWFFNKRKGYFFKSLFFGNIFIGVRVTVVRFIGFGDLI